MGLRDVSSGREIVFLVSEIIFPIEKSYFLLSQKCFVPYGSIWYQIVFKCDEKCRNKHIENYFNGISDVSKSINKEDIEYLAKALSKIKKKGGRIFFLGVGGSAGNASHAVNDFRKLCEIECYTPTDNVSEFSARINDDGWNSSFVQWLRVSNLNKKDAIFIKLETHEEKNCNCCILHSYRRFDARCAHGGTISNLPISLDISPL